MASSLNDETLLYDLASECETLFERLLDALAIKRDDAMAALFVEFQQRFTIWTAHLGVFARKSQCLDTRLKNHPDLQDLVARLLDILRCSLEDCVTTVTSQTVAAPAITSTNEPSSGDVEIKTTELKVIDDALGRLSRLGVTIRRSNYYKLDTQAKRFDANIDLGSFMNLCAKAVEALYPDAHQSLKDYLGKSMITRYKQTKWMHFRRIKLETRRQRRPIVLLPISEMPHEGLQTNDHMNQSARAAKNPVMVNLSRAHTATSQSYLSSIDTSQIRGRLRPPDESSTKFHKTLSIQAGQGNYPQIPASDDGSNIFVCEWCSEGLNRKTLSEGEWRRHIDQDHKPYVCLSEKCLEAHPAYPTFDEWFSHMRRHNRRWHQKDYLTPIWICTICESETDTYRNPQALYSHLQESHRHEFTTAQLQAISRQSKIDQPRAWNDCLLCCFEMKKKSSKGELMSLKRQRRPPKQGAIKSVRTTHVMTNPEPHHSDSDSSGTSSNSDDIGLQENRTQTMDYSNAIARHIAGHLKMLMLLTLRFAALQNDDGNSDGDVKSDSVDIDEEDDNLEGGDPYRLSDTTSEADIAIKDPDGAHNAEDTLDIDDNIVEDHTHIPDTDIDLKDVPRQYDNLAAEDDAFLKKVIKSGAYQSWQHELDEESKGEMQSLNTAGLDVDEKAALNRLPIAAGASSDSRAENEDLTLLSDTRVEILDQTHDILPVQQAHFQQAHFIMSFGRNRGFIGRQHILEKLKQRIPPSAYPDICQRTAIIGLGGVGKTQIAIEVAHLIRQQHPCCSIFWVPAIDMTSFQNGYRKIGQALGVKGLDEKEADVKVLIKTALGKQSAGEWLLIVDNVDDPDLAHQISQYLPFSRQGSILITTRNQKLNSQAPKDGRFNILRMDRNESIDLLKRRLDDDQITDAESLDTLADYLEDLPLAIKQASAYIVQTQMTTAKYLEYCRLSDNTMIELLTKDFEDESRYDFSQNPIAKTWLTSFDHIMYYEPLAAEYLRFICFLAEKDIPISLLPSGDNDLQRDEAIGVLQSYSFITKQRDSNLMDIHRLVRLVMRNWMRTEGKWEAEIKSVIQRLSKVLPSPEYDNRDIWTTALPHVIRTFEEIKEDDIQVDELLLLKRQAWFHNLVGRYKDAGVIYEKIVPLGRKVQGAESLSTLDVEVAYAITLHNQHKHKEAEKICRQALEIRMRVQGMENLDTLITMEHLAIVLSAQCQYQEAEKLHSRVLEARTRILGQEHPNTLISQDNVAVVLLDQGKLKEAEQIYLQLLPLKEKVLDKEHPNAIASMHNFGVLLLKQGKHRETEEMSRQVLEIAIKVFGREHPTTLLYEYWLGKKLIEQGKTEAAEEIFRRVIKTRTRIQGREHPDTLRTIHDLGIALNNQGQRTAAERVLSEALELRVKVLGKENSDTINSMRNLGIIIRNQGRYQDAESLYNEALELSIKTLGRTHPDTLLVMRDLVECLEKQGEEQDAELMRRRIKELEEIGD